MSRGSTNYQAPTPEGQHADVGRGQYNPNTLQQQEALNSHPDLQDMNSKWDNTYAKSFDANSNRNTIATHEAARREPIKSQQAAPTAAPKKRRQIFKAKNLKGKTSLITILLVLFGGAGALTITSAPMFAIVQMKEILSQDLNDQMRALDKRTSTILRAKLKTTTKGSCGAVKIACKFNTMHDNEVEKFRAAGIEVDRDMSVGGDKRGRVTRFSFIDSDTNQRIIIDTPEDFTRLSMSNPTLRGKLLKTHNATYISTTDSVARGVYRFFKISNKTQLKGNTDEERQKNLNEAMKNGDSAATNSLRPQLNSEGEPTGNYIDNDGNVFNEEQRAIVDTTAQDIDKVSKIGTGNIVKATANGLSINAVANTGCAAWTTMKVLHGSSWGLQMAMGARAAKNEGLGIADSVKAGEATVEETTFIGNKLSATPLEDEVVDESTIDQAGSGSNPRMKSIKNQNAWNAPGLDVPLNGGVPVLDSRSQKFVLGGAFTGTFAKMNDIMIKAIPGANNDPRRMNQICRIVRNPLVQGGALVAGLLIGAGSLGLSTVAGVTGSLLVGAAMPYMMAKMADISTGKIFENLSGLDYGDAMFVGTASLLSTMALRRGLKPLTANEAVAYTSGTKQTNEEYAQVERRLAKSTPFDVMNQYSFAGSLVRTVAPKVQQTKGSVGTAALSIASFIPTSLATLTKPAKADAVVQRFEQCENQEYRRMNIGADIFCNVRYGLSDEELGLDPIENAKWMADTGNIDPQSEDGAAVDNGQPWNYKKFLDECANRTQNWGDEGEEGGPSDGWACLSKENEPLNRHFRVFTVDKSVSSALDGIEPEELPGTSGFATGERGPVSSDGWAYPVSKDAVMSQGWHSPAHKGVDLAAPIGKPIFAARDGVVVQAGPAQGFGNWIVISHNVDGKRIDTVYGHMYNDGVLVKTGDTVRAGQMIGKVGNNGQSTGPHLHFEMWDGGRFNGKDFNPEPIINKAKAAG